MRAENPWWDGGEIRADYRALNPRAYFERFAHLVEETGVHRAVVLMGPRRVGKTVLLHHVIARLLTGGKYGSRDVGYISLDHPLYTRLSIEEAADEIRHASENPDGPRVLILDEIQYLADWERHLKAFVDVHTGVKCVVSGSAAAALRLKSMESGAGRFTDFLLPPLTFHEYLDLQGIGSLVDHRPKPGEPVKHEYWTDDLAGLNRHFIDYLNFGGYPEAVSSPAIRSDPARYIGADIVDKVLLRDLPSLYGIQDVQELNALFMTLACNTRPARYRWTPFPSSPACPSRRSGDTSSTWRRRSSSRSSTVSIRTPAASSAPTASRCTSPHRRSGAPCSDRFPKTTQRRGNWQKRRCSRSGSITTRSINSTMPAGRKAKWTSSIWTRGFGRNPTGAWRSSGPTGR